MNAAEALKMVEGIPAEQFIAGMDTDGVEKCCFLGHYSRVTSDNPNDYSSANCEGGRYSKICEASQLYLQKEHCMKYTSIADINDGNKYYPYTEMKIKDRLIHFLTDMIKAGY